MILFFKNLNQRVLTPRWPLTPCLLRSHVWLYPRITVFKSHGNTSMYVDTVINFAKYHIYTYYILFTHSTFVHTMYRMSDHIVSFWTQFRRDKSIYIAFLPSVCKTTFFFPPFALLFFYFTSYRSTYKINTKLLLQDIFHHISIWVMSLHWKDFENGEWQKKYYQSEPSIVPLIFELKQNEN